MSRRNKAKLAAVKAKEAELEEGRKAKESDDYMPRGMGMGGLAMGMGMGMGMGGMPMMYGQNDGGKGGRGRGKRSKKRYDTSDSESEESYDDVSDGGTIKRSRRRRPRRRKDDRRGGRRKDDYSSDETLSSAASSSYYARPTKPRHRNEKDSKYRDRRRQESTKTPTSRGMDYPLGLGPPTTGLPTGSTRKSPGRKGSMKRFQDSVFSTFDSMTNKAAKLEALRNRAIEATKLENEMKLQDDLRREHELEEIRQAKVKEANGKIRAEEEKGEFVVKTMGR